MNIVPYSGNINDYLNYDNVIDYKKESVTKLADKLFKEVNSEVQFIKVAYEYVRDKVSHLLAALLRCKSIPTGFCYQKLILDDEAAPILIYHGLNGVYIQEYKIWIRLDARGNKEGVNAQFSLKKEQLEKYNFILQNNP